MASLSGLHLRSRLQGRLVAPRLRHIRLLVCDVDGVLTLNATTVLDGHPLLNIQNNLNQMFGCVHFSAFDIKDAFWSIIIAPHDRHKFAFSTHDELLQ